MVEKSSENATVGTWASWGEWTTWGSEGPCAGGVQCRTRSRECILGNADPRCGDLVCEGESKQGQTRVRRNIFEL